VAIADETDTPIPARFNAEPTSTHRPGETVGFEFAFESLPNATTTTQDRFERVREYEQIAGQYASGLDQRSRPWYREQHGHVGELSVLCKIEPPLNLAINGVRGLWGIVEAVEDRTPTTLVPPRISLSVLYLAELSEFGTHAGVRNAFSAEGI
jgi:hypothetical protein